MERIPPAGGASSPNTATLSEISARLASRDPAALVALLVTWVGRSFEPDDTTVDHWEAAAGGDTDAERTLRRVLPVAQPGHRAAEHILELRTALQARNFARVEVLAQAALDELWWDGTDIAAVGADLCAALWGDGETGQLAAGLAPHWGGTVDSLDVALAALHASPGPAPDPAAPSGHRVE